MAKGKQAFTDRRDIAENVAFWARRANGARRTVEVVVYRVWNAYGGSEEGGWWRDVGEVVAVKRCRPARIAHVAEQLLSVHGFDADYPRTSSCGSDEIEVRVERCGRRSFGTSVGHYE